MESPEAHLWRQAVHKELKNHDTRKTFTLNGEIIEYKAR
jgi:hypothetical protein